MRSCGAACLQRLEDRRPEAVEQVRVQALVVEVVHHVVDAETVHAVAAAAVTVRVGPVQQQVAEVVTHRGVFQVHHRDADVAAVVASPLRLAEEGLGHAVLFVFPQQVIGVLRVRLADRILPPRVALGDVLELLVEIHLQAPRMRGADEGEVIVHRAVGRVDRLERGGEIVVVVRRGLQRREQHGGGAELPDVAQLRGQPLEVADAVAVGVAKAAEEDLVEHLALRLDGRCGRGAQRRRGQAGQQHGGKDGEQRSCEFHGSSPVVCSTSPKNRSVPSSVVDQYVQSWPPSLSA